MAIEAIDESILAARLHQFGMTLERRGDGYTLLSGERVLMANGPRGTPATLAEIEAATRRLCP